MVTAIVSRSSKVPVFGVVGTVVTVLIVGVVNGVVRVVAIYADDVPVVDKGVHTVDVDSVMYVVGAVVLSVIEEIEKYITAITVSYFGYIYLQSVSVNWN